MTVFIDGAYVSIPQSSEAEADLTLSDSNLIGLEQGQLRLLRNPFPYGALDADVLGEWACNDGTGTTILDRTANGYDMTIQQSVSDVENWWDRDGTSLFKPDNVNKATNASFDFDSGASAWTVEAVVYLFNDIGVGHYPVIGFTDGTNKFVLFLSAGSRLARLGVTGASGTLLILGGTSLLTGYHHFRVTVEAASTKLYVDGTLEVSDSTVHGFVGGTAGTIELGHDTGTLNVYATGIAIASARVSKVVRTGTEVVELFTTAQQTSIPDDAVAVTDMTDFKQVEKLFVDQERVDSSVDAGQVELFYQVDGASAVSAGTAANTGRTYMSGFALQPATNFKLYAGLESTGGALVDRGPVVNGLGFVFAKNTVEPTAPSVAAATAVTGTTADLPVTSASSTAFSSTTLFALSHGRQTLEFSIPIGDLGLDSTFTYTATGLSNNVHYDFVAYHVSETDATGALSAPRTVFVTDGSSLDRKLQLAVRGGIQALASSSTVLGLTSIGRAFMVPADLSKAHVLIEPVRSVNADAVGGGWKQVEKTVPLLCQMARRDGDLDAGMKLAAEEIKRHFEHSPSSLSVSDDNLLAVIDVLVAEPQVTKIADTDAAGSVDEFTLDVAVRIAEKI